MSERWKKISGFESYEVSDLGRIRNAEKLNILKPHKQNRGYFRVQLSHGGKRIAKLVHRLVALEFVGPCEKGKQCAHLDGNRTNNRADNLAWVTQSENDMHKLKHGTMLVGTSHWNAKLTEAQVREIREKFGGNPRPKGVAAYCRSIGVDRHRAYDILNGRRWRSTT